jgi:hypothetical protein
MLKMTLTIREDQKEFLDSRPSINASGVFQERIDELMKKENLNVQRTIG